MDDEKIIELFLARSEQGINELYKKYGKLCRIISYNILKDWQEAEECENDAYLKVWNSIPPQKPYSLIAYISIIIRNTALKRLRYKNAKKRYGDIDILYSELDECIPYNDDFTKKSDDEVISEVINIFLRSLDDQTRVLFIRRYFYFETVESLSKRFGLLASNVSTKLNRTRAKLKSLLIEKGVII